MSIFSDFKENYKFDNITEEKLKKYFQKNLVTFYVIMAVEIF